MNKPEESKSEQTMAQQVAEAARAFQQRRTGRSPQAVTAVLNDEMLVITLHEALSPAEIALSETADGAAQVQDYHRKLFESSADELRQEICMITGVAIREDAVAVETATGAVVHAFTSGTMVQVFSIDGSISAEAWSAPGNEF